MPSRCSEGPDSQSQRFAAVGGSFVRERFKSAFLPKGYPNTVCKEYLSFSSWQFIHSATGTVTGTLGLQALLQAVGLSQAASIGLAATTNWIIKDGFGLLGGVVYASLVSTQFDSHPKKCQFRFLSAGLIQASSFIELLAPLYPHLFLLIASVSNIGKNVGWIASSATRASMNRGLTRGDNLGDVTAKSGAQSTAAGLIGTAAGISLSYAFGTSPIALLSLFVPLSVANMYTAYKMNQCIVTRTFNLERGEAALNLYCDSIVAGGKPSDILRPNQVAKTERFVRPPQKVYRKSQLVLEPDLESLRILDATTNASHFTVNVYTRSPYRILHRAAPTPGAQNATLYLWFLDTCTQRDVLLAFFHVNLLRSVLEHTDTPPAAATLQEEMKAYERALLKTQAIAVTRFPDMISRMELAGWQVENSHLADRGLPLVLEDPGAGTMP
ncbi:MAG: hypothetical protein SGCHY_001010 [Lobulomycetales sp.]